MGTRTDVKLHGRRPPPRDACNAPPKGTNLVHPDRPHREFVEQPGLPRGTRRQRLREHVEQRRLQAPADHLRRDSVHDELQHPEVLLAPVVELSPVAHPHVRGEVEPTVSAEGALWALVVPAAPV